MFILYGCECGFGCKVAKGDTELHLLTLRMKCPGCGSNSLEANPVLSTQRGLELNSITATELHSASMGHGLPEQQRCSPEALMELLMHGSIVEIDLEAASDSNRSIIHSMKVSQGITAATVFFATSTKGATIYKVQV